MKKVKLDKYHYHEATDRCYIVANMIDNMLIQHPVIHENEELKRKAKKAQEHILEVYQMIGNLKGNEI